MPPKRDLTVIVPVYNTMPELRDCLDSLLDQDFGTDRYEIVAIDDGSTDGSGEVLDEYAAQHTQLRVLHQENSGWPGQPRNRGLDCSHSRYVFFLDADDQLGRESLRRQVEFADRHSCDIVVPMLVSQPGEHPRGALWADTAVDADRVILFKTLSPQKLFRREFLDRHDLRFPEGVVPLEDGLMLTRAYLLAKRVSVLADYEYYYKRPRSQGGNISMGGKSPEPFIDSVGKIIDIVRTHTDDQDTADRIVLDIYRRKALKYLLPERVRRYPASVRQEWLHVVGALARERISSELEAQLPAEAQLRSQAARLGDMDVLNGLAEALNAGTLPARIEAGRVTTRLPGSHDAEISDTATNLRFQATLASLRIVRDGFDLEVDISTAPFALEGADWELIVHQRGEGGSADLVLPVRGTRSESAPSNTRVRTSLPAADLCRDGAQVWDACLRLSGASGDGAAREARVGPPSGTEPEYLHRGVTTSHWYVEPYLTVQGNLSFRTSNGRQPDRSGEKLTDTLRRARQWARSRAHTPVSSAVEYPWPRRALNALPTRQQQFARSAIRRARRVRQAPTPGRELLTQLGVNVRGAGPDTIVVSRRRQLDVTNIDADSAIITSRVGAPKPGIFETHKALYERMVVEHVVDILAKYRVNCVLDVGANKGQYARKLRKAGYKDHIISFEPVLDTFTELERNAANDPKWHVQHCALGDTDTHMPMHVVAGTMSSLLPASEYGGQRYKRFRDENVIDVPVRRLEHLLDDLLPSDLASPRIYLKLDTQGYDLEAFAGLGKRTLDIVAMQSEVALLQIYEGMPRLPQAIETYEGAGFEITGMFPVTREKDTGRILEFDCVLARIETLISSP